MSFRRGPRPQGEGAKPQFARSAHMLLAISMRTLEGEEGGNSILICLFVGTIAGTLARWARWLVGCSFVCWSVGCWLCCTHPAVIAYWSWSFANVSTCRQGNWALQITPYRSACCKYPGFYPHHSIFIEMSSHVPIHPCPCAMPMSISISISISMLKHRPPALPRPARLAAGQTGLQGARVLSTCGTE